jgi:septal ring factor EnvC (AmiA/AmiB activator)
MLNKKIGLFLLVFLAVNFLFAESIDDLKRQKNEVQMHLQSLKRDLSHKGVVLNNWSKQIVVVQKKSELLQKQVTKLEQQKIKSSKQIQILQSNISNNKTQISILNQQIINEIKILAFSDYQNQNIFDSAQDQEYVALFAHYYKILIAKNYNEYKQIQNRINDLRIKNDHLQMRMILLKQQEQIKQQQDHILLKQKQTSQANIESLKKSMQDINSNIALYNKKQKFLNNKLNELLAANSKSKTTRANFTVNARNIYEEPAAEMKFIKPVSATIITAFGAKLSQGGRSKGILYDAALNADVKAVAPGVVLYSGRLTGFGEIVVIAHKSHYLSVYSGMLSNVSKNQEVRAGQRIGSSGDKSDQPMGGFYFELRHLGVPVDPSDVK